MADYSAGTQMFSCHGFKEALDNATEETIGDVKAAIRSTMNKVIKGVKALTSAEIRKIYNVPKAILDERMSIFTARMSDLEATLVIGGRSISLSYFGMTAIAGNRRVTVSLSKTDRGTRGKAKTQVLKRSPASQGVSVEVIRGRRTSLSKSAFVAIMNSGHVGIMHRGPGSIKSRASSRGMKHKQALYENTVVSIATMFNRAEVNDAVVAKIDSDLESTFWHELEFYLNRGASSGA